MPQVRSITLGPATATRAARWVATAVRVACSSPSRVKYIRAASSPSFAAACARSSTWPSAAVTCSAFAVSRSLACTCRGVPSLAAAVASSA